MVWFNVRVDKFNIKFQPFDDGKEEQYPVCDKDGNMLDYVKGSRINGYYVNPTTKEKVEQTFIFVNGKPKDKLARTKETDLFKYVDVKELDDFVNSKEYMIDADEKLKSYLKETNTALKFGFSFGGKSPPYFAYIYVNPLFDRLEMKLVRQSARKSIQYQEQFIKEKEAQQLQELTMRIQGLDKAKVEDLIIL